MKSWADVAAEIESVLMSMERVMEFDDGLEEGARLKQRAIRLIDVYYEEQLKQWESWREAHGN